MIFLLIIGALCQSGTDDWLSVRGNQIVDASGKAVWLTGANWFGFNCTEQVFHGAWSVSVSGLIKDIANHGINSLRLPISSELLNNWANGRYPNANGINNWENQDLQGMNTMQIFDQSMAWFKEVGVKVIIDIHSALSDNSGHMYELWYNGSITTEIWISSQVWLANKYRTDDTIIGFDLKNEPHGKRDDARFAKWDGSTDVNNWKNAAETCGNRILQANSNLLIFVEGIEMYPIAGQTWASPAQTNNVDNYVNAWWGGNLRGVADFPIRLSGSKLVYSPHDYGPSVHNQTWFQKEFTTQTLLADYWQDTWAYLLPDYPLWIGEWGGPMDNGNNQKWMTLLRDFMIENHIHQNFWCINPNSGDTGGLLNGDWKTWDQAKYSFVDRILWKNAAGRYIGLDHVIPLGNSGVVCCG